MKINHYKRLLAKLKLVSPSQEWLFNSRQNLVGYLQSRPSVRTEGEARFIVTEGVKPFFNYLHLKPMPMAIFGLIAALLGGTGVAAQQSLPNQFLYPVKLATEQVQLVLTPSVEGKIKAHLSFANKRLEEAKQLLQNNEDSKVVADTIGRYEDAVKVVTVSMPVVLDSKTVSDSARQQIEEVQENLKEQKIVLNKMIADAPFLESISFKNNNNDEEDSVNIKKVALRALETNTKSESSITAPLLSINKDSEKYDKEDKVGFLTEPAVKVSDEEDDNNNQDSKVDLKQNDDIKEPSETNTAPKIIHNSNIPTQIIVGKNTLFSWSATDEDKDNLTWSMDWGDGTPIGTQFCPSLLPVAPFSSFCWSAGLSHTWAAPGVYTVTVQVSDGQTSDSQKFQVTVNPAI